jgi:hypothetical protein
MNAEFDLLTAYVKAYNESYIAPRVLLKFIEDLRSDPETVKLRGINERWWK